MFEFDIRRQQHSKKRYNLVEHPCIASYLAIQGCFRIENNNLTLIRLRMQLDKILSIDTTQILKMDITKALAHINQIIRSHVPDFL